MRFALIVGLLFVCGAAEAAERVSACDTLITLRRLMVQGHEPGTGQSDLAGCREIPVEDVGAVEKRAMIGGMPFECRTVGTGACLWIRP